MDSIYLTWQKYRLRRISQMINDFSVSRCIILKIAKKILDKRVGKFYNRKGK